MNSVFSNYMTIIIKIIIQNFNKIITHIFTKIFI